MNVKYCEIVLVGHLSEKLILSVDKEVNHKVIFVIEKHPLPGTPEAKKILNDLLEYYKKRKVPVQSVEFDFHIQTKPVAELTHLIYQQKLQGFDEVTVNISGGLRYMVIWFYIACSITHTKIIHGDFIYEGSKEIGIYSNMSLITIPFRLLTDKQFEFLKLFFKNYQDYFDFFDPHLPFNKNSLLSERKKYDSLEKIREALEKKRNESKPTSRSSINGFIQKLTKISALNIYPNPKDKKERTIEISYLGMTHFLHKLYTKNNSKNMNNI